MLQLYRTAISMRSDYTQAYINRGDVLMRMNRVKDAEEQYQMALRYEDDNPDIYYNLGVVRLEQGRKQQALVLVNSMSYMSVNVIKYNLIIVCKLL